MTQTFGGGDHYMEIGTKIDGVRTTSQPNKSRSSQRKESTRFPTKDNSLQTNKNVPNIS